MTHSGTRTRTTNTTHTAVLSRIFLKRLTSPRLGSTAQACVPTETLNTVRNPVRFWHCYVAFFSSLFSDVFSLMLCSFAFFLMRFNVTPGAFWLRVVGAKPKFSYEFLLWMNSMCLCGLLFLLFSHRFCALAGKSKTKMKTFLLEYKGKKEMNRIFGRFFSDWGGCCMRRSYWMMKRWWNVYWNQIVSFGLLNVSWLFVCRLIRSA